MSKKLEIIVKKNASNYSEIFSDEEIETLAESSKKLTEKWKNESYRESHSQVLTASILLNS